MKNINLITCLAVVAVAIIVYVALSLIFYGKPYVNFEHPNENTFRKIVVICVMLVALTVLIFQFGLNAWTSLCVIYSIRWFIRGFVEKKAKEPKDKYKHSFMGSLCFVIVLAASVLIFK